MKTYLFRSCYVKIGNPEECNCSAFSRQIRGYPQGQNGSKVRIGPDCLKPPPQAAKSRLNSTHTMQKVRVQVLSNLPPNGSKLCCKHDEAS